MSTPAFDWSEFETESGDRERGMSGGQADHSDTQHIPFTPSLANAPSRARVRMRRVRRGATFCDFWLPLRASHDHEHCEHSRAGCVSHG